MNDTQTPLLCFNCSTPETQLPLINLSYSGGKLWICPQCMPALIHKPETIVENLAKKSDTGSSQ